MANRVKEVSAFDGTSWGAAVPLGANDSNIDITSSTTQPDGSAVSGVSGDSATALDTSAVAVSEGDTSASAWTKFNRFRKRVANNFANYIQGSIATSYNATGSDSAVYSTNVLNNYMANVIGYSGTTAPSAGTVAAQLSSLNSTINNNTITSSRMGLFTRIGSHTWGVWGPTSREVLYAEFAEAGLYLINLGFIVNIGEAAADVVNVYLYDRFDARPSGGTITDALLRSVQVQGKYIRLPISFTALRRFDAHHQALVKVTVDRTDGYSNLRLLPISETEQNTWWVRLAP